MSAPQEIKHLGDEFFEGSNDERPISREAFFGNDTDHTSKSCLETGVINFECKSGDVVNNVSVDFRESSAPGCSPDRFTSADRNDEDVNVKRMKFSVDGQTNIVPGSEKTSNSSEVPNEIVSSTVCPARDSFCGKVMFFLVEPSSYVVTSGCYPLSQHLEMDIPDIVSDQDVRKCNLLGLDGNDGKEVVVRTAIASPVYQESSATRLLIAGPSFTVPENYVSLNTEERPKLLESTRRDGSNLSHKTDPMKDPRPLLQYYVIHLLEAAGWRIEKRKRPSRRYMESVYITPKGRTIREFPRVWRLCGELLFKGKHNFMQENEGKEWADFSHFCSDLVDTLRNVEKEMNHSETTSTLEHWWRLLDPFVAIMYIDRKIGLLRKGEAVKATKSLEIDKKKSDAALALTYSVEHQVPQTQVSAEGVLVEFGGDYNARCQQVPGQTNEVAVEFLTGASIYKANGMCLLDNVTLMGNDYFGISGNEISSLDLTSLTTCLSSSTFLQPGSCLCDALAISRKSNNVLGGSGSVSPRPDSNTNSPSSDKQISECNMETPKEAAEYGPMNSLEKNKLLEGQVTDEVESILQESLGDLPMCITDGLRHSQELNTVCQSEHYEQEGRPCSEDSKFKMVDAISAVDVILKRKIRRKSRKVSKIKLSTLYQSDISGTITDEADLLYFEAHGMQPELKEVQENLIAGTAVNSRNRESLQDSSSLSSFPHQLKKRQHLRRNKKCHDHNGSRAGNKKPCKIEDDDLLVSAIIKNKDFNPSTALCYSKAKACKSTALRKLKSKKGGCRLLPRSLGHGMEHFKDGKWFFARARTVLSWLIDAGIISVNDVIQYRNPKNDSVIKDGSVARDGIICRCCCKLLTISEFKIHAGFKLNLPCLNLFMGSGKPFTLCQLQAWSAEYKIRKSGTQVVQRDEDDQNDDLCGLCGDGGELICCDNCPSTFHQACLFTQELPEGSWYCPNCTCQLCGELVDDKEASSSSDALKCSQCEHKYHEACMKEKIVYKGAASGTWFCGRSCQEVYSGLQTRIGLINHIADGFSWMLLRCIPDDQKVHSAQRFALKGECNSRLALALKIMEECFLPIVDPRTGIDMIPHVLYNWRSDFARLNFHGFYSVVLEKDDMLISAASIRVHGTAVAEMPLIATCSQYRRQGMCRNLMNTIEQMLISFEVEELVIAAIPKLVETWTEGFGFQPLEENERRKLNNFTLMVFPGTVLLKKPLYKNQKAGPGDKSPLRADESTEIDTCRSREESVQKSEGNSCSNQAGVVLVQQSKGNFFSNQAGVVLKR